MLKQRLTIAVGMLGLWCTSLPVVAQSTQLNIPRDSQGAAVTQRVGITDITIKYSRPLVKGRQIWGRLVPYGQVWRAGANENTIIQFTDPVSVEGKPLDRGSYGLHMIPGENEWVVIFSKTNTAWGSFTYKESEDALRVTVKPEAVALQEALSYDFSQPTANTTIAEMRWEKVAVPFKISVDVDQIVAESLKKQLRGLSQYTWDGWDDAANYLLARKVDLEDALQYEDNSLRQEERFENLMTKSKILAAMGKTDDARALHEKALAAATPIQRHSYAVQLLGEKKRDEAFAVFKKNAQDHPDMWFVHSGMARVYSAQGDYTTAVKEMKVAYGGAPDQVKPVIEGYIKRLEAKDDITR